jgi:aspartate kinase
MSNIEEGPWAAKGGGTTLANGEKVARFAEVMASDPRRRFIILSAPGKRFPGDEKVTDLLIRCHSLVEDGKPFDVAFDKVADRFTEIGRTLQCYSVHEMLTQMYNEIREGDAYKTLSRGEWGLAKVFGDYIGGAFIDTSSVVRLHENRQIDDITYKLIRRQIANDGVYVFPGFYGATNTGRILTFARGGSDISGAIIARGAGATLYENWTDIDGVKMASPKIVRNPKHIETMTYREMRELSYRGFDVLHPDAVEPVYRAGIPIHLRSSELPDKNGTYIVPERTISKCDRVVGVAGKDGFTAFTLQQFGMNDRIGFVADMLAIFKENGVSVDHIMTGIDSVTVIVSQEHLPNAGQVADRLAELDHDAFDMDEDFGLVSVVGEGIKGHTAQVNSVVQNALQEAQIECRTESIPNRGISITVGVQGSQVQDAIRKLHDSFAR